MAKKRTTKSSHEPKVVVSDEQSLETNVAVLEKPWFRQEHVLLTVIILVTAFAYYNSINNRFVYDDWYQIERNTLIRSWENTPKLLTSSVWQFMESDRSEPVGEYFRPLFSFLLLVNYQLFGLNVVGWHLASIILHIGSTLLVYFLGKKWSGSTEISLIASMLFGVHPIHVEAVAWASASTELLLGFFSLACIYCYELAREGPKVRWIWITVSSLFAVCAVCSKETGIMIPFFLGLREVVAYLFSDRSRELRSIVAGLIPFLIISVAYLVLRYFVMGFVTRTHPLATNIGIWEWLLTSPYIFLEYLRMMLIPYPLAFVYDYRFINSPASLKFLISCVVLIGLGLLALRFLKRSQFVTCSLCIFLVFLLPAMNLRGFSPYESIIHDRYLYLPSAGLCLLFAFLLFHFIRRFVGRSDGIWIGALITLCLILGTLTVLQNRVWQNDFTLTENGLKHAPDWPFLNTLYGEINSEAGDYAKAERYLDRALSSGENTAGTYRSLGYVYVKQGRFKDAASALNKSYSIGPVSFGLLNNLGIAQFEVGKLDDAERTFHESLNLSRNSYLPFYYLGLINESKGFDKEADSYYEEALKIQPDSLEPRLALANLLAKNGDQGTALRQIESMRQDFPDNPVVALTLASVYLKDMKCEEAVDVLIPFTSNERNSDRALMLLGLGYECLREEEKARNAFERLVNNYPQSGTAQAARKRLETLTDRPKKSVFR